MPGAVLNIVNSWSPCSILEAQGMIFHITEKEAHPRLELLRRMGI